MSYNNQGSTQFAKRHSVRAGRCVGQQPHLRIPIVLQQHHHSKTVIIGWFALQKKKTIIGSVLVSHHHGVTSCEADAFQTIRFGRTRHGSSNSGLTTFTAFVVVVIYAVLFYLVDRSVQFDRAVLFLAHGIKQENPPGFEHMFVFMLSFIHSFIRCKKTR